jgi:DNA-binding CsgD family transcriptional regulator
VAAAFAAACHQATGGNPYFVEALLREAGERGFSTQSPEGIRVERIGPAAVAQAVLLRLSAAPASATALVRAVAVLGDGASVAEAARLAGIGEEEAGRAADLLAALAILKPAVGLEFAHPIVREAVYSDIGPHERAATHARAAANLAASDASEERIAAQIAEAEPAGDPDRVALFRRVAADALARGAPAAAVAWLRRALDEPPPTPEEGELLLELGAAELRVGAPEAREHLGRAVELIEDPGPLAAAVRQLALALTMSGVADRALDAIESALAVVEPRDRELALILEADLEAHAQQAGLEARAAAARRLGRHRDLDGNTPGERLVLASIAFERARASDTTAAAAEHLERGLAGGRMLAEQDLDVAGPFYHLVIGLLATDAVDVADACLEQALSDARARASIPAVALVTAYRAKLSLRRGAVDEAEEDARSARELLAGHGIRLGIPIASAFLIEALIERGELDEAERALHSSGLGQEIPPGLTTNFLLEARGLLHLASGESRQGIDDLVEFGRRDELWGGANPLASRWRSDAALALSTLGDVEGARRMAADELERARRWGAASGIGIALRASALVEEGDGASADRLRAAAESLERSPARLERARALTDLGAALRRARCPAEARPELQQGLELAKRCGARALAEHARTELLAAGGRSSDRDGAGVEQLTACERRVAELAAEGHGNAEIAQALFVTRKTVETHLGRVYRKLDVSGRGKLARVFADQASTVKS